MPAAERADVSPRTAKASRRPPRPRPVAPLGVLRPILASLGLLAAGAAHAVSPVLTSVSPAGGQRGTSVEITLRGDRLADAQELFLYQPGIAVEKFVATTDKLVKAVLTVAPDCPLGEHPLRVRTASGISALRLFFVGPFPTVEEKEPNNDKSKPQPIALNATIEGTIAAEDVDTFAIEARQGQRISVEVEGARLGRTMFDPHLALLDSAGKVLAASDDTPLLGHDGFVSILAPADGTYLVQLRDMAYAGNGHAYRLHVGTFPRPAVAFPAGGRAGEAVTARLIGDPTGEFTQAMPLPRARPGRHGFGVEHDGIAPSPVWVRVTDRAEVATVPAAASLAAAPVLAATVPLAFNGILAAKGEPAFFKLNAKKDQNLEFQVFARRLGSPLDSVLSVLGPKGNTLASNDDAAGNPDSLVRVRIPEDGVYAVKVADQLNRGGAGFVYRVEIGPVQPALTLSIPDTARYDNETRKSIVVPRGNRFAVLLNISRDTFNGDLRVAFDGLPAGIRMSAETVPGSVSAVPVVFEAAADAPLAGNLLAPAALPVEPAHDRPVTSAYRHAVDWVRIQNDTVYVRSEVSRIAAAVVEEVPFKVRIVEPRVPLVQSGEMALQVIAERAEGFDEPITVKMLWNPPGVSSLPDMVIPKGVSTVAYKLNTTAKADVRAWKVAVVASAPFKGGTPYVASPLTALEIVAPFVAGKMELAKVERGQSTRMICVLEQKVPFEGKAVARLVGLPDKVTAAEVEITKDSKEAVFEVVTTDKSPVGTTKNVFCAVTVTRDGEPMTHLIATGSVLRIDAPRAKPAIAAATAKADE